VSAVRAIRGRNSTPRNGTTSHRGIIQPGTHDEVHRGVWRKQGDSPASAPAFTMLCDYFFNTAYPVNPEDPTGPAVGPTVTQNPSNATEMKEAAQRLRLLQADSPLTPMAKENKRDIPGHAANYTTSASVITDNGFRSGVSFSNVLGTSSSNAAITGR